MSQTIPSNRPSNPDQTEPVVIPRPTRLFPYLRPPVEEDEVGRLGGYRVLRLLAEGGMGKVFLAEDIALGRQVALKVLQPHLEQILPGSFERFLREARAMASIKHDNLVTVYAAGQDGDTVYLAMELLHGETLEQRLDRTGPLPPEEVVRIGREIAVGLAAVHERELIHRDIKPANLWLEDPSGRVKILDFGLVRGVEGDRGLTQTGMVLGTPAYLSPEQIRGERFDTRADLFSLGCVLYRMCTNNVPFPATTPMAQLTAVVTDEATPVTSLNPAVPADLADLITQLIDKDPARRPATAAEVVDQLQLLKRGLSGAKRKSPTRAPARTRRAGTARVAKQPPAAGRRWRVYAALACAAFVPLAVIGVINWRKSDRPQTGGSSAAVVKTPETLYLDTLEPAEKMHWPFRGPLPPGVGGAVVVRGQTAPHSIFMHSTPPHEGPASITYRLGRAYSRFSGSVTYADSAPPNPPPVVFVVYLDGKPVWRSPDFTSREQTEAFDLPVAGGESLRIEVQGWGDPRGGHAVWVTPVLTK